MELQFNKFLDIVFFEEKIQDALKDFLCPLCNGVFYQPHHSKCGDTFCKTCLSRIIEEIGYCPFHKETKLSLSSVIPLTRIEEKIGGYTIQCQHGYCNWKGKVSEFQSHLENACDHHKVKCRFPSCDALIIHKHLLQHEERCERKCHNEEITLDEEKATKMSCPKGCRELINKEDCDRHLEESCQEANIECPYKVMGCDYVCKRKEMAEHKRENSDNHNMMTYQLVLMNKVQISELRESVMMIQKLVKDLPKHIPFTESALTLTKNKKKRDLNDSYCAVLRLSNDEIRVDHSNPNMIISRSTVLFDPYYSGRLQHQYVMLNNVINYDNYTWEIRFEKISGWVAFGLCLKEDTVAQNFKFEGKKNTTFFGMSSNGFIWNCRDLKQNNKPTLNRQFPEIKNNDIVKFKYNYIAKELLIVIDTFQVKVNSVSTSQALVPTVLLLSPGDKITFMDLKKV